LLKAAIRDPDPVIFLENELLYVCLILLIIYSKLDVIFFRSYHVVLCSYGESFPVSAEVLDSSFCLPIGKAKVRCCHGCMSIGVCVKDVRLVQTHSIKLS
jgi:pyruvate/2-oxoglutarate/acetoin dehydrogenase E1 component